MLFSVIYKEEKEKHSRKSIIFLAILENIRTFATAFEKRNDLLAQLV